ncbi:MAG: pentapeptide repeat-containing protein [Myxococcales bacterium]|nr:pentapeptide repeat-containing protein [Myxococcales bacterium]
MERWKPPVMLLRPYENLVNVDLEDTHLPGVNLQGACLEGSTLENANLTNANLSGVNVQGANLSGALSLPAEHPRLARCQLEPTPRQRVADAAITEHLRP